YPVHEMLSNKSFKTVNMNWLPRIFLLYYPNLVTLTSSCSLVHGLLWCLSKCESHKYILILNFGNTSKATQESIEQILKLHFMIKAMFALSIHFQKYILAHAEVGIGDATLQLFAIRVELDNLFLN
ncbi:hypothetical protein ACJX0J_006251, partial [Zea mays]